MTNHPDHIARHHVEHVGPFHMYGIHEPVAVNDNVPVAKQPARMVIRADKFSIGEMPPPWLPANESRRGDFMQTYTGRKFWPLDPRAEDVDIRDIAHSLSLQCRYAGHCIRFYSVAEHSILLARWLQKECGQHASAALYALLHDAAEAYTVDVPRPLKRHLVGYKEAEERVMAAICDGFGLPHGMPPEVHEADTRIIADELVNLRWMPWHDRHDDPLGVTLEYWPPERAEIEFLALYGELAGEVRRAA